MSLLGFDARSEIKHFRTELRAIRELLERLVEIAENPPRGGLDLDSVYTGPLEHPSCLSPAAARVKAARK